MQNIKIKTKSKIIVFKKVEDLVSILNYDLLNGKVYAHGDIDEAHP